MWVLKISYVQIYNRGYKFVCVCEKKVKNKQGCCLHNSLEWNLIGPLSRFIITPSLTSIDTLFRYLDNR